MLKITATVANADTLGYRLAGNLQVSGLAQLFELIEDAKLRRKVIYFDLSRVHLVDRQAMQTLRAWADKGVDLRHCPVYLCKWMDQERGQ